MTREEILKKYKHTNDDVEIYFDFEIVQKKLNTYSGYGALWEYSVSHRKSVIRLALNSDKISTDKFVDSLYIYCNDTSYINGETKIPNASFDIKEVKDEDDIYILLQESQERLKILCTNCYIVLRKKEHEE